MKRFALRPLLSLFILLLSACNNPNRQEPETATDSTFKMSQIEFQFRADDLAKAESLKQAFESDSLYEVDTILEIEKSYWAIAVKTRDSMMVSSEDVDSTIEMLSKRLMTIAERHDCELVGFAHD